MQKKTNNTNVARPSQVISTFAAMRKHQPQLGNCVKVLEVKSAAFHRCLTVRYDNSNPSQHSHSHDVAWELGVVHHDLQATGLSRWLFNSSHKGCQSVCNLAREMYPGSEPLIWQSARAEHMRNQLQGQTAQLDDAPKATMVNTMFLIFYFLRHAVSQSIKLKHRKKAFQALAAFCCSPPERTELSTSFGTICLEGASWFSKASLFHPRFAGVFSSTTSTSSRV